LIGDDEHGWSPDGICNFEGGCYAKAINLSAEAEPEIFSTAERFGPIIESVVLDPVTRVPDFADESKTKNTRIAYPIEFIPNASTTGRAGHAKNVVQVYSHLGKHTMHRHFLAVAGVLGPVTTALGAASRPSDNEPVVQIQVATG
jgi:ATP-dependent phosphoenolpyruvate carboxykinase